MYDTQNNLDTDTYIVPISVAPTDVISNKELEVKRAVIKAAHSVDMMSAMSMSRKERRRIGKINSVKIAGSTKPYEKD